MTIDYGAYGFGRKVSYPYDEAIEKTKAALKTVGFGVLTEIDVKKTMKEKLNADFRRYTILGACNPPLAHKALSTDLEIGLLLPCNVVVYEEGEGSVVRIMDPAGRARHRQDRGAHAARRRRASPARASTAVAANRPRQASRRLAYDDLRYSVIDNTPWRTL